MMTAKRAKPQVAGTDGNVFMIFVFNKSVCESDILTVKKKRKSYNWAHHEVNVSMWVEKKNMSFFNFAFQFFSCKQAKQ